MTNSEINKKTGINSHGGSEEVTFKQIRSMNRGGNVKLSPPGKKLRFKSRS